jgi:hypothetical protein
MLSEQPVEDENPDLEPVEVMVSLHAITKNPRVNSMRIKGKVNNKAIVALVPRKKKKRECWLE